MAEAAVAARAGDYVSAQGTGTAKTVHIVVAERAGPIGRSRDALCGQAPPRVKASRSGWRWVAQDPSCSKCADKLARMRLGRDRGVGVVVRSVRARRPPGRRQPTPIERSAELAGQVAELRRELRVEKGRRSGYQGEVHRLGGIVRDLGEVARRAEQVHRELAGRSHRGTASDAERAALVALRYVLTGRWPDGSR